MNMKMFLKMTKIASRGLIAAVLPFSFAVGAVQAAEITLTHVHGLSYSADGGQLFIPSHDGLAIYQDGKWSRAPGPQHDFMGFSATQGALYSSGHPAPGSSLRNPFGLIKSTDGGKNWTHLGLTGESDFHLMATSYNTNNIYVFSPAPNSRMKEPGIYHTADDGKNWRRRAGAGLSGQLGALAVHPTRSNIVAAATDTGVYLSEDHANRFSAAVPGMRAVSVSFDLDGAHLWIGGYTDKATLTRLDLKTRKLEFVAIPPLTKDAIAYLAQNPARHSEYAAATFLRDVYVSNDAGKTWKAIALRGEGR